MAPVAAQIEMQTAIVHIRFRTIHFKDHLGTWCLLSHIWIGKYTCVCSFSALTLILKNSRPHHTSSPIKNTRLSSFATRDHGKTEKRLDVVIVYISYSIHVMLHMQCSVSARFIWCYIQCSVSASRHKQLMDGAELPRIVFQVRMVKLQSMPT